MKANQLFTIFSAVLLALPAVVFAQDFRTELWNPEALAQFIFPNMKAEWLVFPNIIYYVFVPFLLAFMIIYGFLKELRLFRHVSRNIEIGIALAMAFLLLPSGLLTYIVNVFYAAGTFIALIGFGAVFIVGVLLWSKGTARRLESEYSIGGQIDKIEERIEKYKVERKGLIDKGATNLSSKEKRRLEWLNHAIDEEEKLVARMTHK